MNQYEVMYIIDPAVEDQQRAEMISRFSSLVEQNGGQLDRVDEWGKRRLAYSINYKTEGYYVLMYVTAPSTLPKELERNLQISDSILRYLVIRFEGELPAKREPLRPYAPAAAQPEEAANAESAEQAPAVEEKPAEEEAASTEAPAPEAE